MQWFEILIIVIAVSLVIAPIVLYFLKKKNGTLTCECGHRITECGGNCSICSDAKEYLDNRDKLSTKDSKTHKYIIEIKGMKCSMCESHINDAFRKNVNCLRVKSNRRKNTTELVVDKIISFDQIKSIVTELGYEVGKIYLK